MQSTRPKVNCQKNFLSRFRVNLDKLDGFLTAVEQGYTKLKNPYHNDIHAADVTQTLHYFIGSAGIAVSFLC